MEYSVRAGALSGFAVLVHAAGADPVQLLSDVGLTLADLTATELLLPVGKLAALLNRAAQEPGLEDIGLRLADQQGLEVLGLLGHQLGQRATLAEAFADVQRYMALHNRAEHWRLQIEGANAAIMRFEHSGLAMDLRHYHELAMANCCRLMQVLGGTDLRPLRLEFAHRPRLPRRVYRQYFGCDVEFDQEQDRMLVPLAYLQRPVLCKAQAGAASERFLHHLSDTCEDDLLLQVSTLIQQTLGTQQHSLPEIAGLMKLQPRTLQRRLEQLGIIYRQLVTDVRMQLACHHLGASDIDITLLSAALGYSDISAFSRAFRSRYGCSPRVWRQRYKAQYIL